MSHAEASHLFTLCTHQLRTQKMEDKNNNYNEKKKNHEHNLVTRILQFRVETSEYIVHKSWGSTRKKRTPGGQNNNIADREFALHMVSLS